MRQQRNEPERLTHPIPPLFDRNSTRLFLGSFPSPKSRQFGFYYGHPQNRFWLVLATVFNAPLPITIEEKKAFCLENRIALWDVIQECTITGAADQSIRDIVPNPIEQIIAASNIRAIFTTGSKAYDLYAKYALPLTNIPAVRLPSTSPANCAVRTEILVDRYREALRI